MVRTILFFLFASVMTGCTMVATPGAVEPAGPRAGSRESTGAATDESGAPSTAVSTTSGENDIATDVVETAFQAIGTPYVWGGSGENGFDCSGLIQYSYRQYGIELPRISRDQLRRGSPVELRVEALEPGDVLGFSAVVGGEATHVGLYVEDGRFIHSSSSGVRVSNLREPYWQQHFMAARRIVQ